jgi:hypothetical protein
MTLRLVNLDCPLCGSAMRGEGLDTIFFCGHCGGAAVLDEEQLQTVDGTALLATPGHHPSVWRPAWRLEVEVRVHHRVRSDGRTTPDSGGRRTFYIPAFSLSLDDLTRVSRALSKVSEAAKEVPKEPIRGGTLSVDDALMLVRHILIGDEVHRSDMLASVTVDVDEISRSLVALPFEEVEGGLRCAVTGIVIPRSRAVEGRGSS